MVIIQETAVENSIANLQFACDLKACKGACCTMPGGKGAPLLNSEAEMIENAFPVVRKYLSKEHLQTIETRGLYEGSDGNHTTPCYRHGACVFVTFENGIAKCSFEKAFLQGELSWRKPLSCHLFPIRVRQGFQEQLHFEYLAECEPALRNGANKGIFLSDFLKDPLIRVYGHEWYDQFLRSCKTERAQPD